MIELVSGTVEQILQTIDDAAIEGLATAFDDATAAHALATDERNRVIKLLEHHDRRLRELRTDPRKWVPLQPEDVAVDVDELVSELLEPAHRRARLVREFLLKSELCELLSQLGVRMSETTFDRLLDPTWRPTARDRPWPADRPAPVVRMDGKTILVWVPGLNPALFERPGAVENLEKLLSHWPRLPGWKEGGARRKKLPVELPANVERISSLVHLADGVEQNLTRPIVPARR